MLGSLLNPKKAKCFFCPTVLKEKKAWKFEINTAEGVIVKHVCESCARDLETMKEGLGYGE